MDRDPLSPPLQGVPGPTVEIWPRPTERPAPGARPRPPRQREKERKVVARMPFWIRKPLEAGTELSDAVDAVWDAIPWKDRIRYHEGKKNPRPDQKARALWDLFDKIEWNEAVKNLIANQVEDFAYGQQGQKSKDSRNAAKDFLPNTGRGWQSGPWDTQPGRWLPPGTV